MNNSTICQVQLGPIPSFHIEYLLLLGVINENQHQFDRL